MKDRMKNKVSPYVHIVGVCAAVISGGLYGAINSTRFTLEQYYIVY
jgi:hypothetical protein